MDDGAAESETLFPTAGEGADSAMQVGLEASEGEDFLDALARPVTRDAVDTGVEAEVLGDGEVFIEAEFLRHVADVALDVGGVFADVHAEDGAGAFSGCDESAEGFDDGGFAGAVGAEEAEEFSFVDVEGDVVDCGEVTEADGEAVGGDNRSHCSRTVADMPDLRAPSGLSTRTFTPKTWCWRSSRVWTLRGRNSAWEAIS